jgi:hypothetical protein
VPVKHFKGNEMLRKHIAYSKLKSRVVINEASKSPYGVPLMD